jgi:hypothetical protein
VHALHVSIPSLSGYDTFLSPALSQPAFASGETQTVFWAKGDAHTPKLSVEWREQDGSRWIAVVPITTQWQRYSLPPAAFKTWANSDVRAAQGFDPDHAVRFNVGLAFSHTGSDSGVHQYWIANIGAAKATISETEMQSLPAVPTIDALCPGFEFFAMHGPLNVTPAAGQSMVVGPSQHLANGFDTELSVQPRPSGNGFDRGRAWRWIPLLDAQSAYSHEWRGVAAAMVVRRDGGAYAVFPNDDVGYLMSDVGRKSITNIANRMRDGLFLLDGGADHYAYLAGQTISAEATVMSVVLFGGGEHSGTVLIRITDQHGRKITSHQFPFTLDDVPTPQPVTCICPWSPLSWPRDGYVASADLIENGQVVDHVQNDVHEWTRPAKPDWVTTESDGHFHLDGHVWKINGVNYMPSSGIAQPDFSLYEHWLSLAAYDPEVIERDLTHIQNLGFNAIYVFQYIDDVDSQNLLDLLWRCREHHLRVELSLRPGLSNELGDLGRDAAVNKFDDIAGQIIEKCHLAENDTVFAYEVDWEPDFGRFGRAKCVDPYWEPWITKRYGSVGAAEAAWGVPVPKDTSGKVVGCTNAQLHEQIGAADTKLVAAYRRFLDDWLADTYGTVVKFVHQEAPHQLVSFRMTGASDGSWDGDGPNYQFEGLARAVDFLSPESYGEIGSASNEASIPFRIAYGRSVAPKLPVIWAETGISAWDNSTGADSPSGLVGQGTYYQKFYALATEAGADGIFWWWYPGGFRIGENSDFGLINPDGTDRQATASVRTDGKAFLESPFPPAPDIWLTYDRDDYPNGAVGVFHALRQQYVNAIAGRQHPGLKALSASKDGGAL